MNNFHTALFSNQFHHVLTPFDGHVKINIWPLKKLIVSHANKRKLRFYHTVFKYFERTWGENLYT